MTINLSDPIILFLSIVGVLIMFSISFFIGIIYERKYGNIQDNLEYEFKDKHHKCN
jgi:hypothetical protein